MFTRQQLKDRARLQPADLKQIQARRRSHNRFGFAYQVGFVRLMNRFPNQQPFEVIDELVTFTALQIKLDPSLIEGYQKRQQTISEHQQAIASYLKLRHFGDAELSALEEFLFQESCRLEQSVALQARARAFLREQAILEPADSRITRIMADQRKRARQHIYSRIAGALSFDLQRTLDSLLEVGESGRASVIQKVRANPSKPSVDGMLGLLNKLEVIEQTGVLDVDLAWLNSNYQRALFHLVRKASAHRLRETERNRRQAALVCFLWQSYRDAVDQVVDMFDKLLLRAQAQAKEELAGELVRKRRGIQKALGLLNQIGNVALDDSVEEDSLRDTLFASVPRTELEDCLAEIAPWISGRRLEPFHGVVRRYGIFRRFAPRLLSTLELCGTAAEEPAPCKTAVDVLKQLNEEGKRKLPDDVPVDFLSKGMRSLVVRGADVDRRSWECALLLKVRDEIKSGNLAIEHSKRFGRLDDFFISDASWQGRRERFFSQSGLPSDPAKVPEYLETRLGAAFDGFLGAAPDNTYAVVDEDGWHLSRDKTVKPDAGNTERLKILKKWLSDNMRRIRLPDLLIEVDNDIGFTRRFSVASNQDTPAAEETCLIIASVMAHGCNIGPRTMAQLIPDATYEQLKRVSDWQLTTEAQRLALGDLVSAISGLDTSLYWGEGKTSASDGQRFSMRRRVLQQTWSPKFSDFALEFYTFIADNYAPYFSMPIECTDRDAAFVIDGICYNESDLQIEEHYTDTHGYTEVNFAAFAMLGKRFCPRIKGVKKQRIYRIDPARDYGMLATLVGRADRTIDTKLIAEQWDRMAQFYASLSCGHTTASVALRRLAAYNSNNRFYRANRDFGRILKTEFILQYMSEPQLRGRVRRGLLKVEQLHALARAVFYGRRGHINARELWEQMNSCSCLTLILACIIYWQAKEMSRVIQDCDPDAHGIDLSLLAHVSPIEWDNVVLYGQYVLDQRRVSKRRKKHLQLAPEPTEAPVQQELPF